ncbi:MAG TPA: hypothetical protein VEX17_04585, partial [Bacillales bacterium]|nr:hypothetical protein [Bacillales bacterium]
GINHLNEQWPDYWTNYFQKKGYMGVDCIRKKIWQNDNVGYWYAQNILMFVRQDYLENHHLLKREFENTLISQLSISCSTFKSLIHICCQHSGVRVWGFMNAQFR